MKVSKLLTGLEGPLSQDLILQNALKEIDRLEAVQDELQKQIDYYENIFGQLKQMARCDKFSYGPFININNIYETDHESLFADLMELLQLEEPDEDEGKEDTEENGMQ